MIYSAFLRCVSFAAIACFLSALAPESRAQSNCVSAGVNPAPNPNDVNPPGVIVTPNSGQHYDAYSITFSANSSFQMSKVEAFAYVTSYYTGYQPQPLNNGLAKYTFNGSGASFALAHTWTLTNQDYGGYSWQCRGTDVDGNYAVSGLLGLYY